MNNIIVFISAFFIVFISNYGECQVFTIYNSQNSGIPFNTVRCLEKQGDVLWVGTDSGLGKFQNNNWEVYNSSNSALNSDDIRSLKSEGDSVIWIGTVNGGLFSFNGTDWVNFNVSNSGLQDNLVRDINIDQNNDIWLATTEGLFMYDRNNWNHWNMQDSNLLTNNITSIQIGLNNEKYVGTINGGIIYFDSSNQFNEYTISNSDLPDNSVVAIEVDENGQPWFLSPAAGLVNDTDFGGPWLNFNNLNSGLPSNSLNCLQFMGNELVIGSEIAGLIFKDGNSWNQINTTNSSLPDDHILCLVVDDEHNIWAGTFNEGLCNINLENSLDEHFNTQTLIYPNPINSGNKLFFNSEFSGMISLHNNAGLLLVQENLSSCKSWIIPSSIKSGSYFISYSTLGRAYTKSIIIK